MVIGRVAECGSATLFAIISLVHRPFTGDYTPPLWASTILSWSLFGLYSSRILTLKWISVCTRYSCIQLFTLIGIRIRLPNIMWIPIRNPGKNRVTWAGTGSVHIWIRDWQIFLIRIEQKVAGPNCTSATLLPIRPRRCLTWSGTRSLSTWVWSFPVTSAAMWPHSSGFLSNIVSPPTKE